MEEGKSQVFEESWTFNYGNNMKNHDQNREHENCISSSESCVEDSAFSNESSSSSSFDTTDDASSSPSSSLSTNSSAALYDLTDLMEELPIKRGLSKFYNGKSESFTSLSMVTSLEDLVKKGAPYKRKMKASKSYAAGLNSYKPYTLPKPVISKKSPKGSLLSSPPTNKRGNVMAARAR